MSKWKKTVLAAGVALAAEAAHAQSSVINPLYAFGEEEFCVAYKRDPDTGLEIGDRKKINCKEDVKSDWIKEVEVSYRDLLIFLLEKYPLAPKNSDEYKMTSRELLLKRLVPTRPKPTKPTKPTKPEGAPPEKPDGEIDDSFGDAVIPVDDLRFKDDMAALRLRRSLLRIFEAAYSGGAGGYFVQPNLELVRDEAFKSKTYREAIAERCTRAISDCTNKTWLVFITQYRPLRNPLDDDIMIDAFIRGEDPFKVAFGAPEGRALEIFAGGSERSAPRSQKIARAATALIGPHEYKMAESAQYAAKNSSLTKTYKHELKGKFTLTTVASEFAKDKPSAATLGMDLNLNNNGSVSSVKASAALGYVFDGSWTPEDEKKRAFDYHLTPYISISQSPVEITIPNPIAADVVVDINGEPQPIKKEIAFATIFGGLRTDFEFKPRKAPAEEMARLVEGEHNLDTLRKGGLSPIGDKFSVTVGGFTDNYSDQQGVQYAAGWSPGGLRVIPAYRRKSRMSLGKEDNLRQIGGGFSLGDWFRSGYAIWDAEFVLDHVEYGRSPRDFDNIDPNARIESADSTRLGLDAEVSLEWKNVFSPAADKSRIQLKGGYQFRDNLANAVSTPQNWSASLNFLDVLAEKYSLGLEYKTGDNILTLEEFESFTLNLGLGF